MNGGLGGQLILALLLVLLTIALYIYFETFFLRFKIRFQNRSKFYEPNKRECVLRGKLVAADSLCKSKNTPTARLIGKGISRIGKPLEDINTAIETAGKLEVYQLEKNVSVLATIAGVAPMIGFLGNGYWNDCCHS